MDEAVEVRAPQLGGEAGAPQERVLRRVDLQRRSSRPHGQQPDPERGSAADGGPPDPERFAAIAPQGGGGRDEQDRDAHQEELRVGEAAAREHDRGEHGRAASWVVQQRARREEGRRGDEVRDVPGREVDGERACQQPRERRSDGARPAAHQGRGRETDRHAKDHFHGRGRLDDRQREGSLEDERERRRAGPVGDRRESVGPPEP